MSRSGQRRDPRVARATPARWRAWAQRLARWGRRDLAAAGADLLLGFGLTLAALSAFTVVAHGVASEQTLHLDTGVRRWFRLVETPALERIAQLLSLLGSELLLALLVVFLVVFARQGRWGTLATLCVATVGAQLLNNALKEVYQRTRPSPVDALIPAQVYSFPSGHAMVAAAFYLCLLYAGWRLLPGAARLAWAALVPLLIAGIGASRLYLGVHYVTDVVAGSLAGAAWTAVVVTAARILARRHPVPAPERQRAEQ